MELKNDHLLKKAPASVVVDSHNLILIFARCWGLNCESDNIYVDPAISQSS